MKIMCQEHYDKVVHYAKELGDESLQAGGALPPTLRNRTVQGLPPPTRSYSSSVIRTAHWA